MGIVQHRSKRKSTGGVYQSARKKRKFEKGSRPTLTKIGERKTKTVRSIGGHQKTKLLNEQVVNLLGKVFDLEGRVDPDTGALKGLLIETTGEKHEAQVDGRKVEL